MRLIVIMVILNIPSVLIVHCSLLCILCPPGAPPPPPNLHNAWPHSPVTFRTRAAPPPTKIVPMLGQCRTPSPAPTPPPILPLPPPSPTGSRGGSRETRTASLGIPPLPSTRVKLPAPTVWVAGEASAMPLPRLPQSMG